MLSEPETLYLKTVLNLLERPSGRAGELALEPMALYRSGCSETRLAMDTV
ncbi:hypothetical protein AGR4C_Cc100069 [Agrobacterium tumefaciens str. Kerr 14]|jgi:hypothetical protein|uniref:Uncharacterized protein n=1 Tax=Agrobacterium tumefaciens str. Kerr 14 TaxID=1183424 RepID=A0A1S7NLE1_AGRTU|nr:hypothetical protein AGR4C_Cc100069 [Agrobacterium tumefaciens str. Kerr 14]